MLDHRENFFTRDDRFAPAFLKSQGRVTIADIARLYAFDKQDIAGRRRAAELPALPESWHSYFRDRVEKLTANKAL